MFPLIIESLCAHKISFVQHFTRTHLYLKQCVLNRCKSIFGRNIYVCTRSFLVCARLTACVEAHMHCLEGTLLITHWAPIALCACRAFW